MKSIKLYITALFSFTILWACKEEEPAITTATVEKKIEIKNDPILGDYFSTQDGQTIYMFSRDLDGVSTCDEGCELIWQPVGITSSLPEGISNEFGLFRRSDGFLQLSYLGWPLYTYANEDTNETSGDGKEGEWYLAKPDYTLFIGIKTIDNAPKTFLLTPRGQSVYYKSDDPDNQSSCTSAACLVKYPPLKLNKSIFPSILDETLVQNTNRPDTLEQSSYKNKPLYIHSLDARGEATGQGFLGVWFVMEEQFF